jgi:hypothetical protein
VSDNITLPRADAEQIREALVSGEKLYAAIEALDAALAEPEPTVKDSLTVDAKPEPATDEQIIASWPTELQYLFTHHAFYKGFRAAERFHGIGGGNGTPA